MDYIQTLIDIIFHLDIYLADLITVYKNWIYLILFLIVFCETGLIFAAFLPGDSLLFVTGTLAALPANHLNVHLIVLLFLIAAITGNACNYIIGRRFGIRLLKRKKPYLLKQEHLEMTHRFFEKYGSKTIVIARFIPFVRTFAPFIAGMGKMNYNRFRFFNIIGAFIWILSLVYAGYFLGNIPFVKNNISWFILCFILLSNIPAILGIIKNRRNKKKETEKI